MPALFTAIVTPVLARLLGETSIAAELTPAFMAEVLGDLDDLRDNTAALREGQDDTHAMLQELLRRTGGFAEAVDQANTLTLEELKTLADAFGETGLDTKDALVAYLAKKAEDYASYRATIDSMDDRVPAIANLKGAAQDAAARLDFDEVEALLSRVNEVETEIATETKVARAQNALLRNDPDTAFRLLSAAADSFGSIDPLEPARKRAGYQDLLYQHGRRYSGPALDLAAQMNRDALATLPRETDETLWAFLQNSLGLALASFGARAADTGALQDAVAAHRAALEVRTREASPIDWATTQNNLGNALQTLGAHAADTGALLQEAVAAYGAALEVRTREASPMDWAGTQNDLGIALWNFGARAGDTGTLQEAAAAFRAALEVTTREASPMDWATTQNNLGTALAALGARAGDTTALEDATAAFRAALEVRTWAAAPFPFAQTMANLARAHLIRATLPDAPDRHGDLASALEAVDEALEIFTPEHAPHQHEKTCRLRAEILNARIRGV
jgi:tetratricopeptide (TPR) repeat protein